MMTGGVRMRAILVLASAFIPASLMAQDRWDRQVRERLNRAIAAAHASRPPIIERSSALNGEESASFQVPLSEGGSYAILAVCDDDCTRLELTLLAPSGSELAKDRNSESLPTLQYNAKSTATHGVRVRMEGCRWNPCRYAVAVVLKAM